MRKSLSLVLALLLSLLASSAFAQDKDIKVLDFDADQIEGDLMMPSNTAISVKEMDELSSLIKAREDFVDEMRKTVDEL